MRGKVTIVLLGMALLTGAHSSRAAPAVGCWTCKAVPTGSGGSTCQRTWHDDVVDDFDTYVDASGIPHGGAPCPCVYEHGSCSVPGFNPEVL